MRTKALILSAAVAVAGIIGTQAQVYSVNVVGYVNLALPEGFSLIANQLDNGSGNLVPDVLAGVPEGTVVYKWTASGYVQNTLDFGEWTFPDMTLAPGEGAFVLLPAGGASVTLVGEVPQGTLTVNFPAGFWIASSHVPQVMDMSDASFSFPAADGDVVYLWSNETGYTQYTFDFGAWDPQAPELNVGRAFFFLTSGAKTWTRDFSVN
jgi:hypothetical protein